METMEIEIIQDRLKALRKEMETEGMDYYIIPTSDFHGSEYVDGYFKAREYFSGFTGSSGTLVVGKRTAGLWTDGRYFIQAEKELKGTGITLFKMQEEGVPDIPDFLYREMEPGWTLGFDGRVMDCGEGRRLEKKLAEKAKEAGNGKDIAIRYDLDLAGRVWKDRPTLPSHPVWLLPKEISGKSTAEKLREVRETMKEAGAEYLLLARLDDLMWLLNIRGNDVACNPVALSYGFVTPEKMYFFVQPSEVTPEFSEYAGLNGIVLKDYGEITDFLETFDYTSCGGPGKVLLDEENISYALYKTLEGRTGYVRGKNPTERLKAVKNETELARMEEVYLRDSAALVKFIYWLKHQVGRQEITEITAAAYLDGLRREIDGFVDLSFPTISAYKENAAMMHYEAEEGSCKSLAPEGLYLVDSGGQYLGGTTDVTRTVALGETSSEMKKHFTLTAVGMLQLSDAKFLQGCTGRNLDILARQPLWKEGIDYKCGTGHGIGYILNVHEGPQNIRWRLPAGGIERKEAVLEPGMVVSNEPGVYREGSHGIRTENIMVVENAEKNGDGQFLQFRTLTYVPIDRDAIDTAYMQPVDIERWNRYHAAVYEKTAGYLTEDERQWLAGATAPL